MQVGGLLGQPLQGGQVFLGGVEGERQVGGRRDFLRLRSDSGRRLVFLDGPGAMQGV